MLCNCVDLRKIAGSIYHLSNKKCMHDNYYGISDRCFERCTDAIGSDRETGQNRYFASIYSFFPVLLNVLSYDFSFFCAIF